MITKFKNILEIFLIITILCLVVWFVFFKKPVPTVEYTYVTDTIYVNKPYGVPEPFPVYTPPSSIIEYLVDSTVIKEYEIAIQGKEIIIRRLRDSVRINENFLKQFPLNPKLLALDFKQDTFMMGILEINGRPGDYSFPVDYNSYSYRWNLNDGFTRIPHKPTKLPPTLKEPFANYFVGGAVDVWNKMPQFTLRAEKEISSIRLFVDTRVGLLDVNSSNFSIGVEYKINGKINNRDD